MSNKNGGKRYVGVLYALDGMEKLQRKEKLNMPIEYQVNGNFKLPAINGLIFAKTHLLF